LFLRNCVIPTGAVLQAQGGIARAADPLCYVPAINVPVSDNALLEVHSGSYTFPISLGSVVAALP